MRCAPRCARHHPGALEAFGTDLASTDALATLTIAPTPESARGLSRAKIASALRKGGRQRNIDRRAEEIQAVLRAEQLGTPALIANAHGIIARSAVALITSFNAQIAELEAALSEHFEQHPDAKVVLSLPGLGTVLGARVLGEFGDDRTRFSTPKCRKNYAGTSPVTKASGRSNIARLASPAINDWEMPATNGPFARSPTHREPGTTTTSYGPGARPTARPCVSWPTGWSGSSTSVWSGASSTTN